MNVEIGIEGAQFPEKEYINRMAIPYPSSLDIVLFILFYSSFRFSCCENFFS